MVKTEKYKDYTIEIVQDQWPTSPDDNGNTDLFLVYDHKDFTITRENFNCYDIWKHLEDDSGEHHIPDFDKYYIFKVYAYIHSGIALSVASHSFPDARWDVSMKGFILAEKESFENEEKALHSAKCLASEWNQYLNGEVYGYKITKDMEEIDACWGYYGDPDEEGGALFEAKIYLDEISQN